MAPAGSCVAAAIGPRSAAAPCEEPALSAQTARARFVEQNLARDADGDGRLSENEVVGAFATMDADQDGFVSEDELLAFASKYFMPFSWVNRIRTDVELPPGVHHRTFESPFIR